MGRSILAAGDDAPQRLYLRLPEDPLAGPEADTPPHTMHGFAVAPALRDTLGHLMLYRETLAPGEALVERVLPDGAVRLTVHLGDAPRAEVIGAWPAPALVRLQGAMHGLTATLQPGAAAALLGVPAHALTGRVLALQDLWGGAGRDLAEQVAEARGDPARAAMLQSLLQARRSARGAPPAVQAVACAIEASAGTRPVAALARDVGLGERRLQQLFREHVGLSPRTAARLARLQALLRALRRARPPAWADLAPAHGFYDQAHLANEFRALCGLSPGEFAGRPVSGSSKTAR